MTMIMMITTHKHNDHDNGNPSAAKRAPSPAQARGKRECIESRLAETRLAQNISNYPRIASNNYL